MTKIGLAISIAAIVVAITGVAIAINPDNAIFAESSYSPNTKNVYLFTDVNGNINEDKLGIPPDMFSLQTIVVNQGDKVRVHFYNLEAVKSHEKHSFTIEGDAYDINQDVDAGQSKVIEFTATESGVFTYICTHHPPTMRGQLIVLPTSN